jgi:plastocyanin
MQRLILATGLIALAVISIACSGASAAPATPTTPAATSAPGTAGDAVTIVAKDITFTTPQVSVAAGKPVTIEFDNQDGAPHNIAISDASGASVFKGDIVAGTTVTYQVPALAAGTYTFICEVHPDMKGTITAQ